MLKTFSLLLAVLSFYTKIHAQLHGTGAILSDSIFSECPKAPKLISRDLLNLPKSFSLRKYAPTPGNQGALSTCAGWAVAYSVRTMVSAIQNDWTKAEIDANTYSPSFIYNQIRLRPGCNIGTSIVDGLDILKKEGVLKLKDFSYDCDLKVDKKDKINAKKNRIKEYRTIAYGNNQNKVILVKKSLCEKNPVIIAINCPPSFQYVNKIWKPDSSEYNKNYGGHALAVIGYDDNKYGGAFELLNSWGTNWGDGGFAWIKYSDFDHFCVWAGEEIPSPKLVSDKLKLSGSLLFRLNNGSIMKVYRKGDHFCMKNSYPTGTLFHLILSNDEPSYVYAIGSDLQNRCTIIFPYNKKINPYLPYQKNDIKIPEKDYAFQLDKNVGTTYFCFLYSPVKLDINSIKKNIKNKGGNFYSKIHQALLGKIIAQNQIKMSVQDSTVISFNAKSDGKNVMISIVEIPHI